MRAEPWGDGAYRFFSFSVEFFVVGHLQMIYGEELNRKETRMAQGEPTELEVPRRTLLEINMPFILRKRIRGLLSRQRARVQSRPEQMPHQLLELQKAPTDVTVGKVRVHCGQVMVDDRNDERVEVTLAMEPPLDAEDLQFVRAALKIQSVAYSLVLSLSADHLNAIEEEELLGREWELFSPLAEREKVLADFATRGQEPPERELLPFELDFRQLSKRVSESQAALSALTEIESWLS